MKKTITTTNLHGISPKLFIFLLCTLIALLGSVTEIQAQPPGTVSYKNIKFEEVLRDFSPAMGGGFLQDMDGFFWIGTQQGLVKWDGKRVQVFTPGNSGLSGQSITGLLEDKEGKLWIATSDSGLNRYDKETDTFTNYLHDPDNPESISSNALGNFYSTQILAEDHNGHIWICTFGGGVNKFDTTRGMFIPYQLKAEDERSLSHNHVNAVYVDKAGTVWIGTRGGLDRFARETDTFVRYTHHPERPITLSDNTVQTIREDSDGFLWIGTGEGGLNRLDRKTGVFKHYRADAADKNSPASDRITAIAEDNDGNLWLTYSANTLSIFDRPRETFVHYEVGETQPYSLKGNQLTTLYFDRAGNAWIIATGGSINKYDPKAFQFTLYLHDPDDPHSMPANNISRIFTDRRGNIWLDAYGKGFFQYNKDKDNFTRYDLPGNARSPVFEDSSGTLWVGGGTTQNNAGILNVLDRKTMRFTQSYRLANTWFTTRIIEDKRNPELLWITTFEEGLGRFNKKTGAFNTYTHDPDNFESIGANSVWELVQDKDNDHILWLGLMGGGLNKFDTQTETFVRYQHDPDDPQSISGNSVFSILETTAGEFWVMAHGNGLNKFDKETGVFERYTQKNGLFPDDKGVNILEDGRGNLWIGSLGAIIKFNPQDKTSQVYGEGDAVFGGINWGGSALKDEDGRMWFGGVKGVNAFYPDQIRQNDFQPPVYITRLSQGGEALNLGKAPEKVMELRLGWQNNFFEFEAAALNYTHEEKNQYQFILEGWDKDWYSAGTLNRGRYTGLPGGEYTLRVRGSNNDGVWSEHEAALKIIVKPPFWRTWWAYAVYILIAVGLVTGLLHFQTRSQSRELARQRLLNEQLRRIDALKDEFMANTSHELRTPLHGIIGLAESIKDRLGGDSSEQTLSDLSMIVASGKRLSSLVDDVLDYSRLKHKEIKLKLQPVGIKSVAGIVLAMSQPLVGPKPLKLINAVPDDLPLACADESRVYQVLYNLVGNAFKFTEQGAVTVSAAVKKKAPGEADFLFVSVTDSGPGISADKVDRIFESFEQAEASNIRAFGGTGLGLAISRQLVELHGGKIWVDTKIGQGSTFIFSLPISVGNEPVEVAEPAAPAAEQPVPVAGTADLLSVTDTDRARAAAVSDQNRTGLRPGYRSHILVVDDEPVNLQLLNNYLSVQNYRVSQCISGMEAITAIEREQPDLVLLDVMMPRMSGYEVSRKLREKYTLSELPILMLTVRNQSKDFVAGFQAGANDYITKPFDKDELLARVDTLLRLKQSEAENRKLNEGLEQKVIERTALLEAANRELEAYSYSVSHDLRAPLRHVTGFVGLLKKREKGQLDETSLHYLDNIADSTHKMDQLIGDLLNFSRTGRAEMQTQRIELNELVKEAQRELASESQHRRITWKIGKLPTVEGDVTLLRQAWLNLLSNAIKFTVPRTEARIEIGAVQEEANRKGEVTVFVRDNGVGFDSRYSHKLFGVFQRLHGEDEFEGTGIGLATVQRIVQRHRGRIWAESKPDGGAAFYFTLKSAK